jgi:hypothetical protein
MGSTQLPNIGITESVTLNVPPVLLVNIAVPFEWVPPVTRTLLLNPVTLNVPPVLLVNIAVHLKFHQLHVTVLLNPVTLNVAPVLLVNIGTI